MECFVCKTTEEGIGYNHIIKKSLIDEEGHFEVIVYYLCDECLGDDINPKYFHMMNSRDYTLTEMVDKVLELTKRPLL